MIILSIDTSCDDTSAAVLKFNSGKATVLSNIVSSQVKLHQKYGGIYPSLAKREHQKNLPIVFKQTLQKNGFLLAKRSPSILNQKSRQKLLKIREILEKNKALYKGTEEILKKYKKPKINAIAVTVGPGLEPCLWTGVNFARCLSLWWNIPLIPVNHMEGHILAGFVEQPEAYKNSSHILPAIALIASGGHTQLVLVKAIGRYKIIGETRDDAAGECFDKTARILKLGYPGGPAIAKAAKSAANEKLATLPRPMLHSQNYDFSFSGLKTAVLYQWEKMTKRKKASSKYVKIMAREIEQAIVDVLTKKTIKALKDYRAKSVILGGGVAANQKLRQQFRNKLLKINRQIVFTVPSKKLCTDNAVMIAVAAYFHQKQQTDWEKIEVNSNLRLS